MNKLRIVSLVALSSAFAFADAAAISAGFSPDVEPVFTVAGIVMVAIGSIWAIKKVIALGNKS